MAISCIIYGSSKDTSRAMLVAKVRAKWGLSRFWLPHRRHRKSTTSVPVQRQHWQVIRFNALCMCVDVRDLLLLFVSFSPTSSSVFMCVCVCVSCQATRSFLRKTQTATSTRGVRLYANQSSEYSHDIFVKMGPRKQLHASHLYRVRRATYYASANDQTTISMRGQHRLHRWILRFPYKEKVASHLWNFGKGYVMQLQRMRMVGTLPCEPNTPYF